MRFALLLPLGLLTAVASASFDLVLISDSTNGVIHRVDGATGTYLGSFGRTVLISPQAVALDQANQRLWVGDMSAGLVAINYNTGEPISQNLNYTVFHDMALTPDGSQILRTSGVNNISAMTRISNPVNGNTGAANYQFSSNGTGTAVGVDSTGDYIVSDRANNRVTRFNPNGTLEASSLIGSFNHTSKGTVVGNQMLAMTSAGIMLSINTQSFTTSSGLTPSGSWTAAIDVAAGHPGWVWGLGRDATQTRLQRYAVLPGSNVYSPVGQAILLPQIASPTSLAVVVAPEPGTMTALALGGAALLRRRRKRA